MCQPRAKAKGGEPKKIGPAKPAPGEMPETPRYFLRWRMRERMRRFFRPSLRRPRPDFLTPTRELPLPNVRLIGADRFLQCLPRPAMPAEGGIPQFNKSPAAAASGAQVPEMVKWSLVPKLRWLRLGTHFREAVLHPCSLSRLGLRRSFLAAPTLARQSGSANWKSSSHAQQKRQRKAQNAGACSRQ
jgi:hypothetical protein